MKNIYFFLLFFMMFAGASRAADQPQALADDVAQLKAEVAAQRREIDELRTLVKSLAPAAVSRVAEPASASTSAPAKTPVPASGAVPTAAAAVPSAPLQLQVGSASITPVGFMDMTAVYRSRNGGSSIGTNFGSIPYNNTVPGQLSEFRFSAQNSRIGLRVDARVHGASVLGYFESDFLGFSPANAAVTSNSNSLRMRLYWADVRKGKYELLGGQSWSMLTPNRSGLSALPGDLFYSQDIDVNYQLGLVWSRNPTFRFIYHPTSRWTMGLGVEAAEQYGGGSSGGGIITLPSALATPYASQINTGGNTFGVPNQRPDVVAKIAYDTLVGSRNLHVEVAGVSSGFKFYNPLTQQSFTKQGGGGSVNLNLELVRNFRLLTNNFYSDGGGRWLFGQGPDLIVRGDGSPSPVHASSTVSGFEFQPSKNLQLYAYYGGVYFQKNVAVDPATGKPVGYGYAGSPNSQNRAIQEATFGFTDTFWKDPKYGALQLMGQYSYLTRNPWYVAAGQPAGANLNMIFINLRYLLPGAPPRVE